MSKNKTIKKTASLILIIVMTFSALIISPAKVSAATYNSDYRYWSQGSSDYIGMREVGCLIVAQAKMLYEAGINRSADFNPDWWYNWLLSKGYIASPSNLNMRDHAAPQYYASSVGKTLKYLGKDSNASETNIWANINAGHYVIVDVSGHYVLVDNNSSKSKGQIYIYDSFNDPNAKDWYTNYNTGPRPLSVYSTRLRLFVYQAHTHNYTSTITKQPTCTQPGERKYTCSCGSSYTETINAAGHKYVDTVVPPTETEQGYTIHTCSVCNNSYKDNYIDPPKKEDDGWYYCDGLPQNITSQNYEIQYNNHYEEIQQTSPGSGWKNEGVAKSEWQNSGEQYKSNQDLATSDSRILVYSCYYHFCGPTTGDVANYEQTGEFSHFDAIDANAVTSRYLGDDNGHPYYFIYDSNGNKIWCKSGLTCDGAWGTHGARSCAWYKENTYQDRVKIDLYKFTRDSGWVTTADPNASSAKIRYKPIVDDSILGIIGDVDCNKLISIGDATVIQNYLAGITALTPFQKQLADTNADTKLTILDVTEIQSYLAGISNNYHIGTEIIE